MLVIKREISILLCIHVLHQVKDQMSTIRHELKDKDVVISPELHEKSQLFADFTVSFLKKTSKSKNKNGETAMTILEHDFQHIVSSTLNAFPSLILTITSLIHLVQI